MSTYGHCADARSVSESPMHGAHKASGKVIVSIWISAKCLPDSPRKTMQLAPRHSIVQVQYKHKPKRTATVPTRGYMHTADQE